MKNVTLKTARKGFSLVEMLVVIAVIGVIAAIAIPNIGNVNDSAKEATARRNAQSLASVASAAIAAGYTPTGTTPAGLYTEFAAGVTPTTGAFKNKQFRVPNLPTASADVSRVTNYLTWDSSNKVLLYNSDAVAQ